MAAMELEKLQHQREMKAMELSARIGLAARSHQSQQLLNEQRLTTQTALEALKLSNVSSNTTDKPKENPNKKDSEK